MKKKRKRKLYVPTSIEQAIVDSYKNNESTYIISEKYPGWYPNKVNRLLRKMGVKLRDKSAAQKINLQSGRSKHPTEGTTRSKEVKAKISEGVSQTYRSDPEKKVKRSALSKKQWSQMSEFERANLQHKAAVAVRQAAESGSKVEKYLAEELRKLGYVVLVHSTTLLYNQSLEVDLFLPGLNTVIECDGLSHYENIWGQEALERTRLSDHQKNGLVLQKYNLIRLQAFAKKFTAAYGRRVLQRLMKGLQPIIDQSGKLLDIEQRMIIIKEES